MELTTEEKQLLVFALRVAIDSEGEYMYDNDIDPDSEEGRELEYRMRAWHELKAKIKENLYESV